MMDAVVVIDAIVLLGIAVVLPLALVGTGRWLVAAAAAAVAMALPTGGAAAAVAAVWVVVAALGLARALGRAARARRTGSDPLPFDEVVDVVANGFALVAAGAFTTSRAGLVLLGIHEPIVELTSVHFTYAGVGALRLAAGTVAVARRAGLAAVAVTVSAPPVVALGFVVHHPVLQVGGAVLMAAGVLLTASLELRAASQRTGAARTLLIVSGLAPWIPMALAVTWALSQYRPVPALSIPDMARTHGVANVVFVVAGLVALRGARRDGATRGAPSAPSPVAEVV